jgi:hypothetical protein
MVYQSVDYAITHIEKINMALLDGVNKTSARKIIYSIRSKMLVVVV